MTEDKLDEDVLDEAAAAAEASEDADGYYEIDETEEGVFLTVHPPRGQGFPVSHTKIENELDILAVMEADLVVISEVVAKKDETRTKIAPPQESHDKDAEVEISVSEDKMKATATVTAPEGEGNPPTPELIKKALAEAGVVAGIGEKAIADLIENETFDEPVQVAVGIEPETGKDGAIEYQFRVDSGDMAPTEMKDGSVDFYNLDLVENMIEGQVVAIKTPPREGIPGKNVLGEEIKAEPGKEVEFVLGKNVAVSEEDESLLVATTSGQAMLQDRRITIVEVYTVKGDVDYATGNITFVGNVNISGNVRSGFVVKAGENIDINGIVENAKIEAGGSVSIRGGIFGQETGEIDAEGDINIKFIENAIVKSKASINVSQVIMHSQVTAEKKITVGGKGVLVGGLVRAGEEVRVKTLGSKLAVATEIEVGINPTLIEEYYALQESLKAYAKNYDKVTKGLTTLNQLKEALKENFPADKLAMLEKLRGAEQQLKSSIEVAKGRVADLDKKISQMRGGRVVVGENIHPGVKVTIGKSVRRFDEDVKNLRDSKLQEKSGEVILVA